MLEPPNLPDEHISAWVQEAYGLAVARIAFLPLGADMQTAVYRAVAADGTPYFVKLRRGAFDQIAVTFPKWLGDQGVRQIIAPLTTAAGELWSRLGEFAVIVYPFVAGRDGYAASLSDRHWRELGAALKRMHAAAVPAALLRDIPRETYTPRWRDGVRQYLARVECEVFDEPIAAQLAAFLRARRGQVRDLVDRAERLARLVQVQPQELVACHADLHAGNVLIDDGGALYIVDWDTLTLAPKERDLMFAGGGLYGGGRAPREEERLFYEGYGRAPIDPSALAYYRYERIVQDIAAFCEQLLSTSEGGDDRPQALRYLTSNFQPGGVLEIAYRSDTTGFLID